MKYLVVILSLTWALSTYAQDKIVSYTVLEGDWIYKILRSFNKETKQKIIQQILDLNPKVSDPDLVYPGQTLLVPIRFKEAVERNWRERGVTPPPEKREIVKTPVKPEVVIQEKIKYVYVDKSEQVRKITVAPIYSYTRVDYNSTAMSATAPSKVNYGLNLGYSEKTGNHMTNFEVEYLKLQYKDERTGLDNISFSNINFSLEKSWKKSLFEFSPGFQFGQRHYLQYNSLSDKLEFINDLQAALSLKLALFYEGSNKNLELGVKTSYFLKGNAKNLEIDSSLGYNLYLKVTLKFRKNLHIQITPSYQRQQAHTSESRHIYQYLGIQAGFIYQI